jgi:hypothetical protein
MKARNFLVFTGVVLILFNALSYIKGNFKIPEEDQVNKIAYILGRNLFILLGMIFLLIGYIIHKKVNRARKKEMIDSFLK